MQVVFAIIASAIGGLVGGLVGGYFALSGVKLQSRGQSEAALHALMVEVTKNKEAAVDMTPDKRPMGTPYMSGQPDPGWLKHSIWDSQLPYVVQLFDREPGTLIIVRYAYSLLDAVPGMIEVNMPRRGEGLRSEYAYGGWIDEHLIKVRNAFQEADNALESLSKRLAAETLWQKMRSPFHRTPLPF